MSSLVRGFFQKKPSLPVDYKNHVKQFLNIKTDNIIKWYDEFTGMGEVRKAQSRVLEEEQGFITAQNSRRKIFNELKNIQNQIKALNSELETTSKSEDKYLYLITQEHKLLKEEKVGLEKFSIAEKFEKESFLKFSNTVRFSHEVERAQVQRTKYWSVIGSILGTIVGIIGSTVNNSMKINAITEFAKSQFSNHQCSSIFVPIEILPAAVDRKLANITVMMYVLVAVFVSILLVVKLL